MSYDDIAALIDMGKGFAAQELGTPHDVYRLKSQDENGNTLIPANQIASGFLALVKVAYGASVRTSFEGERQQGVLWYELTSDFTDYLVGDEFILNDPVYGAGYSSVGFETAQFKGFSLADHSPIKKVIGGRLSECVQIYRLGNGVDSKGRADRTLNSGTPVILSNGIFSLGENGAIAAKIPGSLISTGKSYGDRQNDSMPGESRKSGWELYVPALNGFDILAGDRVVDSKGARYVVIVPYTQFVGATGAQWFLERETP